MAVESDTERAIFFDTDDFGSSATLTDVSAGTSSTIKGIFDKDQQEIIGDSEVGIIEDVPKFHCLTSDVSSAVFFLGFLPLFLGVDFFFFVVLFTFFSFTII